MGPIVTEINPPVYGVIPFAVRLPTSQTTSVIDEFDHNDVIPKQQPKKEVSSTSFEDIYLNSKGMVGTITWIGTKSIMVWIGWGDLIVQQAPVEMETTTAC